MIIISSQQLQDRINGDIESISQKEFERLTLMFGSFLSIMRNKKLTLLEFLKFISENPKLQKAYTLFLHENSFRSAVEQYVYSAPHICKKVFSSTYNANT